MFYSHAKTLYPSRAPACDMRVSNNPIEKKDENALHNDYKVLSNLMAAWPFITNDNMTIYWSIFVRFFNTITLNNKW